MDLRDKIINRAISNMQEFGYPKVTKENIMTDTVYKEFFKSMLNDNLGKGYDDEIKSIISEIK